MRWPVAKADVSHIAKKGGCHTKQSNCTEEGGCGGGGEKEGDVVVSSMACDYATGPPITSRTDRQQSTRDEFTAVDTSRKKKCFEFEQRGGSPPVSMVGW